MRRIFLIALLAMSFTASVAMAQTPDITSGTGTFASGQSFTLQGSGFGSKANAAPLKYDNFESGSVGNELNNWLFDTGGGDVNPEYSNEFVRPNSSKSAVCNFIDGQYLATFGVHQPSGLTKAYLDFWVLFDRPNPVSRNHKLFRFYPNRDSGLPNHYLQLYCNDNSPTAHFTNDGVSGDAWGDTRSYPGWENDSAQHNWVHIQVYVEQSDADVKNGILKAWFDERNRVNRTDYLSRDSTNNNPWRSVWFGNYAGHGSDNLCSPSGDSFIYFDNVYVDVTQARVEAGNNAVYDNCTHREIQVPTSWSNDQVVVDVNSGSFNGGQQVWFFVVDEDGKVSDGQGPYIVDGPAAVGPGQPTQPVLETVDQS